MPSEQCTDTSGHHWVLKKEDYKGVWAYGPKYTFWKKTKKYINNSFRALSWEPSKYFILKWKRRWYCTKCREFDTTEEVLHTIEDIVKDDWVVYDWESDKYIYPEGVNDGA